MRNLLAALLVLCSLSLVAAAPGYQYTGVVGGEEAGVVICDEDHPCGTEETGGGYYTGGPGGGGWQIPAVLAAITAFMVLLVLYLIGFLVDSAEMRGLARQEMWQVFITAFFIIFFVAIDAYSTNALSSAFAETFGAAGVTHVEYAIDISQKLSGQQWNSLKSLTTQLTIPLGSIASTSGTCNIMGSSFSYSGCAGVQVPFSSLIFATNVLVSAMLVNNAQTMLLNLSQDFFFPVLLPLGLFFRCFQFTRGAGGLLIAIAVAFYFIYPFSVMLTWGMAQKAAESIDYTDVNSPKFPQITHPEEMFAEGFDTFEIESECNPMDMDPKAARTQAKRLVGSNAGDGGTDLVDPLLFQFFIAGLFTTMLNLLITLSAVRGLASIFGAEVDISALARIS